MKRLSSHLVIDLNGHVLKNTAVSYNRANKLQFHNLFEGNAESARTLFYDGIISPPLISVSRREIERACLTGYYVFIPGKDNEIDVTTEKRLIIDFETEDIYEINILIQKYWQVLYQISIIDLICACCITPSEVLTQIETKSTCLLWNRADLVEKKILPNTNITEIRFDKD